MVNSQYTPFAAWKIYKIIKEIKMQSENYRHSFSFAINDVLFIIHNNSTIFNFDDDYYTSAHYHHVAEIHYVYEGSQTIKIINKEKKREDTYSIEAGQLLLIHPYVYHAIGSTGRLTRLTFTIEAIVQKQTEFAKSITEIINRPDAPLILRNKYLNDTFDVIRSAFNRNDSDSFYFDQYNRQLLMTSVVTYILDLLLKKAPPFRTQRVPITDVDREYLIKNYLCLNCSKPNALSELADILHLSIRQTQTMVEKVMGKNFKTVALERRMELADTLIECTDMTLTEICEELNYSSYSSFYTAFVNYFGVSPTERKKQKNAET